MRRSFLAPSALPEHILHLLETDEASLTSKINLSPFPVIVLLSYLFGRKNVLIVLPSSSLRSLQTQSCILSTASNYARRSNSALKTVRLQKLLSPTIVSNRLPPCLLSMLVRKPRISSTA